MASLEYITSNPLLIPITFGFIYFLVWLFGKRFRVNMGFEPHTILRIRFVLSGVILAVWTCFYISLFSMIQSFSSFLEVLPLSFLLILALVPALIDIKRQYTQA